MSFVCAMGFLDSLRLGKFQESNASFGVQQVRLGMPPTIPISNYLRRRVLSCRQSSLQKDLQRFSAESLFLVLTAVSRLHSQVLHHHLFPICLVRVSRFYLRWSSSYLFLLSSRSSASSINNIAVASTTAMLLMQLQYYY